MPAQRESERGETSARPPNGSPHPHPPTTVERLTHEDVQSATALFKKVWDAERPGLPADVIKAWQPGPLEFTSRMEGVTYFAVRRDGRVVGVIGCELVGGSAHLLGLVVDPDHRRQGIGSALARAAVDWAKRNSCPSIWFDTLAKFTASSELIRKIGFTEVGLLHRHFWNEDIRLFEQTL